MGTLTDPMREARHTEIGGLIVDEVAVGVGLADLHHTCTG